MRYYKELEVAKELAVEAGKAVLEIYSKSAYGLNARKTILMTTADHAANAIIVAGLGAAFPDMAILAESVDDKSRLRGITAGWWTPSTAPRNSSRAMTNSASISPWSSGPAGPGGDHTPAHHCRELFYAVAEEGTYLEVGDEIKKAPGSQQDPGAGDLRSRSKNYRPGSSRAAMPVTSGFRVVEMGSSIKGLCHRQGEAEIYYSLGKTMEWDTAAMEVIVTEAGGIFMQLDDTPMRYNRKNPLNQKGFYVLNNIENKLKL